MKDWLKVIAYLAILAAPVVSAQLALRHKAKHEEEE